MQFEYKTKFLTNERFCEKFDSAAYIIAEAFICAMDSVKKGNGGCRFVKKILYIDKKDEYSASLYSCLCTRRSFNARVNLLTALIRKHGYFFAPFQVEHEIGVLHLYKKEPDVCGSVCYTEEAKQIVSTVFKGLAYEGYGTLDPSREEIEAFRKGTSTIELSDAAKAFLAQPSTCFY